MRPFWQSKAILAVESGGHTSTAAKPKVASVTFILAELWTLLLAEWV